MKRGCERRGERWREIERKRKRKVSRDSRDNRRKEDRLTRKTEEDRKIHESTK